MLILAPLRGGDHEFCYCQSSQETKQEAVGKLSRIYIAPPQPTAELSDLPILSECPYPDEPVN
jgi:hypothetical protein